MEMTASLLHAAAFEPTISKVALIESLVSYRSLVMNRRYNSYFIHYAVSGTLTAYDLPDLAATLAPRKLLMVSLTNKDGKVADNNMINQELQLVREAYKMSNAAGNLNIRQWQSYETLSELFGD